MVLMLVSILLVVLYKSYHKEVTCSLSWRQVDAVFNGAIQTQFQNLFTRDS